MQQTMRESEQDGRRTDREKRKSKDTYSDHTQENKLSRAAAITVTTPDTSDHKTPEETHKTRVTLSTTPLSLLERHGGTSGFLLGDLLLWTWFH